MSYLSHSNESSFADQRVFSKLRWRCRRGMLENDLIISRYLDENENKLEPQEIETLYELMELSDNELWDVLSGRIQIPQSHLKPVVDALQAIRLSSY